MPAMSRLPVVVCALVLVWAGEARAWNPYGHRVIAAAAYRRLEPGVARKVDALLALNPDYRRWTAGVAAGERALAAFMRASSWADDLRTDPRYSDGHELSDYSYRDRQRHADWHYINMPLSLDGTPTRPPAIPNVQTQIAELRRRLADPGAPDGVKSYALVWLLHLVGDVHMPLHCVARFDRQLPEGDRGGTRILLSPDPRDHLHGFWDRALGDSPSSDLARATAAARALPVPTAPLAAITDEGIWVAEGVQAARTSVYRPPVGPGPGPFALDAGYSHEARAVAAQRIALAGVRLPRLLNDALR
jgi:hypothetical protein